MEYTDLISIDFIVSLFDVVHKDYCDSYNVFSKKMKSTFQNNLTEMEANEIIEWGIEYKNSIENRINNMNRLRHSLPARPFLRINHIAN